MMKFRGKEIDPRVGRMLKVAAALEGALKVAALVDLARRPATEVRGSKAVWATVITLVNSVGAVPIAYFVWGRHAGEDAESSAR